MGPEDCYHNLSFSLIPASNIKSWKVRVGFAIGDVQVSPRVVQLEPQKRWIFRQLIKTKDLEELAKKDSQNNSITIKLFADVIGMTYSSTDKV